MLETNPNHYGVNYQLATALDRAGSGAGTRPQWESVLKMVEGLNDKPTIDTVRPQLTAQQQAVALTLSRASRERTVGSIHHAECGPSSPVSRF